MTPPASPRILATIAKHLAQRTIRAFGGIPTTELAVRWNTSWTRQAMRLFNGIQLSGDELAAISMAIRANTPCNLLVFGAGHDTPYWTRIVTGGTCVILEDNPQWTKTVRRRTPHATIKRVEYHTSLREADSLIDQPNRLAMHLPADIRQMKWHVILVDAPAGYSADLPGRMQSIYEASRLASPGCVVFVHDCDRRVEMTYSRRYLNRGTEARISDRLLRFSFPAC